MNRKQLNNLKSSIGKILSEYIEMPKPKEINFGYKQQGTNAQSNPVQPPVVQQQPRQEEQSTEYSPVMSKSETANKKNDEVAKLKAEFNAEIAKTRAEAEASGSKIDDYAIRKTVSDKWAQDANKQERVSALGLGRLGKVSGSQSRGLFGYRHSSASEAEKSAKIASERAAKLPEPERPYEPEPRKPFRYINPNTPEGRIAASGENYGLNNPESPYFDKEASIRRQQEAEANVARVQQQAAANLPAAKAAVTAATAKYAAQKLINKMVPRSGTIVNLPAR